MLGFIKRFESLLVAAFLCSVALNGVLARQLNNQRRLNAVGVHRLAKGDRIPAFVASDLAGTVRRIDVNTAKTKVMYVFAPTCGWCAKNLDNLKAVAAGAAQRGFEFYAVSLATEGVAEYVQEHQFTFTTLIASPQSTSDYHLAATPSTLVVSDGQVKEIWAGAYTGDTAAAITSFFGVSLPGLVTTPRTTSADGTHP